MDHLRRATGDRGDNRAILTAQAEFYQALFDGARNEVLQQTVQGLQVRVAQLRALTLGVQGRDAASLAEFDKLHGAIVAGDAKAAERAAIRHVGNAAKAMVTAYEQRGAL